MKISTKIFVLFLLSATVAWSQILPPPTLISPSSGTSFASPPTFTWGSVTGSAGFRIGVSANSNLAEPLVIGNTVSGTTTSWTPSQSQWNGLNAGQTYYWSVRTMSSGGQWGNWASSRSISRQALLQLQLTVTPTTTQTVDWGQTYSFNFTVTANGSPVQDATIGFSDPIRSLSTSVITNSSGQASYSYAVPNGTANNTYTFNFKATKSGYTSSSQVTRYVQVSHTAQYSITVTSPRLIYQRGQTVSLEITIRDNNIPVSNVQLGVYDDLALGCFLTGYTNSNGSVTYTRQVPMQATLGYYMFGIIYQNAKVNYTIEIGNGTSYHNSDSIHYFTGIGINPPLGQSNSNLTLVPEIYLNSTVETLTSPGVVFTGLLCVGAGIGTVVTYGTASPLTGPVIATSCGAAISVLLGTQAFNIGKNTMLTSINLMNIPEQTKQYYRSLVNRGTEAYGLLLLTIGVAKTSPNSLNMLSGQIYSGRKNSAIEQLSGIIENLAGFADALQSGVPDFSTVNTTDTTIAFSCKIRVTSSNTSSLKYGDLLTDSSDTYKVYTIGLRVPQSSTGVQQAHSSIPPEFQLNGNFPNPFNQSTTISYSLPEQSYVKVAVYNLLGHEMATLVDQVQDAGNKSVEFHSSTLSSGVYFYRMFAVNSQHSNRRYMQTKKLILAK